MIYKNISLALSSAMQPFYGVPGREII